MVAGGEELGRAGRAGVSRAGLGWAAVSTEAGSGEVWQGA